MMLPEHVQRVTIAALLHDLPALAAQLERVPAGLGRLLALAALAEAAEQALVRQAEHCATPGGDTPALVTGQPLRPIFVRLSPDSAPGESPVPADPAASEQLAMLAAALEQLAACSSQLAFEQLYPQLLAWLETAGRALPVHRDDLPLADHARLAGAAAACLAGLPAASTADSAPFCLVGVALLGSREYCLGAAASLEWLQARAAYLAALEAALGHELAERLGVPFGNVLFRVGGQQYLLAPNSPATAATLAALGHELSAWLHKQFAGELALALAQLPVSIAQLQPGAGGRPGFSASFAALHDALDIAAQQAGRGALLDSEGWREDAFVLREYRFSTHPLCVGCGRLPGPQAGGLCGHCARDARLAAALAGARALAYYRTADAGSTEGFAELLPGRGFRLLAEPNAPAPGAPYLVAPLGGAASLSSAGLAELRIARDEAGAPLGLPGMVAPARGRAMLGYLALALDGPEALFAHGLHRSTGIAYDGAAHLIALGRELARLRAAELQQLCAEPRYAAFAMLALGDELLLVGPWEQAAPLALDFQALLAQRSTGLPGLTCSAGLLFVRPTYPLARAADEARDLLGQAQLRPWVDADGRRRLGGQLTLLGDTFRWTDAPLIFDEIARLQRHGQSIGAPLLRDLVEYGRLQRLWRDEQRTEGLRYKALFVYSLARALRRGDAELYRWADELIRSLHGSGDNMALQHIGLVASYVLLARHDD